jgi:hypothetical protein
MNKKLISDSGSLLCRRCQDYDTALSNETDTMQVWKCGTCGALWTVYKNVQARTTPIVHQRSSKQTANGDLFDRVEKLYRQSRSQVQHFLKTGQITNPGYWRDELRWAVNASDDPTASLAALHSVMRRLAETLKPE